MDRRPPIPTPEAADYLGITVRHLRLLVERREVPFHKVGRSNMFDRDDLDTYLAENRVEAVR